MKKNRLRLISIIDLLFTNIHISDEDIKSLDTYERFIDQKSVDALRMYISRDIKELKELKIIQDSKTQNDYYELTKHFENIRKEYHEKIDNLYKSDISDEELEVEYTSTEEIAETIFDTFSISKERRVAIRKSMELDSFLDSFTLAFKTDDILKVTRKKIRKIAVDIMFEDYLLPDKHLLPWSDKDEEGAIRLVRQGKCIDQVAKKFKRTRRAIIRKLPELKIIKNLILGVDSEIKNDPEAVYYLVKLGLLQQGNNSEEYKLSDQLQSILEWNKSTNANSTELSETILYDYYFSNCKKKEFIPLSGLHLEMQKVDLHQNYFDEEDDFEEIDTARNDNIYWRTKRKFEEKAKILEKENEINTEEEPNWEL